MRHEHLKKTALFDPLDCIEELSVYYSGLRIRNYLFRIRIQIFIIFILDPDPAPDPDPTRVFKLIKITVTPSPQPWSVFGIMTSIVIAFLCIWVALLWRLIMTRLYCTFCSTRPFVNREPVSLSLTMYTECQQLLSIHRPVRGKGVSEPQQSGKS